MEFDWLYLNPWHYPGFSGSCYAIKDYSRVDPRLLPEGHLDKHYEDVIRSDGGLGVLRETLAQVRAAGLRPIMDLVINHTSRDSPLVSEHPEWYVRDSSGAIESPSAIDPADSRNVTVWGDLAEIDNARSPDRDGGPRLRFGLFRSLMRRLLVSLALVLTITAAALPARAGTGH